MNVISAAEDELLQFFKVDPQRCDANVPWPYNECRYEVQRGDFALSFAVVPASRDVRVRLQYGGATIYELTATGVEDVSYHADKPHQEALEIMVNARDRLWLRLNPSIEIIHEVEEGT